MELLRAGLTVTLMGMGVVFMLLSLLVGVVHAMSRFAQAIEGMPSVPAADEEIVSVISAAVAAHRSRH